MRTSKSIISGLGLFVLGIAIGVLAAMLAHKVLRQRLEHEEKPALGQPWPKRDQTIAQGLPTLKQIRLEEENTRLKQFNESLSRKLQELLQEKEITAQIAGTPPGVFEVAKQNNQFAFELFQAAAKDHPGNLFLSPYSISTALAMTYAGARGATAEEMARTLHFSADQDFHTFFGMLQSRLYVATGGYNKLRIANALWGQGDFLLAFLNVAKMDYGGKLERVDFRDPEKVRQIINDWVSNQTENLITELMPQGSIDEFTKLVLTNAIYFKGIWKEPFEKKATTDQPFKTGNGSQVAVPTMFQEESFPYAEDESIQALEMPYFGERLSMVIVLPKTHDGAISTPWTFDKIDSILAKLREKTIKVYLPRYRIRSRFELNNTLADLGMPTAFKAVADFSGITGDKNFYISAALHEAYVAVDEEGTEAAAATGVGIETMGMPPPTPVFRADHPFLFLIRERTTGSILFLGRVDDPSKTN